MNLLHKKEGDHPVISSRSKRTSGQKAADKLTGFMGSWFFITFFIIFILTWMSINFVAWERGWDPYPFILLNLCLSCLAAFQAPIILMSQNRQTERDRIIAKYDYAVNRKTEREVQKLHNEIKELKKMLTKK